MSTRFIPVEKADIEWRNGLPYSRQFQDIYFSIDNGLAESRHVFIEGNNLSERFEQLRLNARKQFIIAETGFGTGLNFLLTWSLWREYAPENARLTFLSCEKHPLSLDDLKKCHELWPQLAELSRQFLEAYPVLTPGFHPIELDDGRVRLTLMLGDVVDTYKELLLSGDMSHASNLLSSPVDAWFLDGFAPAKNQAMWSEEVFLLIVLLSRQGTTLATFSAAGLLKDSLSKHGFSISKQKGYGRKKHMMTARLDEFVPINYKKKRTPWHLALPISPRDKSLIVIGAGLAGCFCAYSLARRGWQVKLLDENSSVAQGASAIPQAVLFPKLSAYRSPLTELMLMSFLYASDFYSRIPAQPSFSHLKGSLLLAHDLKEQMTQGALSEWLRSYPELASLLEVKEASEKVGLDLEQGGVFIPDSGWVDTPKLCQWLIDRGGIDYRPNTQVGELHYDNGHWHAKGHQAEILIIASGYQAARFFQSSYLPIKPIRGQMTRIPATAESACLTIPLCASGHVLPSVDKMHWLGASYDLGQEHASCIDEDDLKNLKVLKDYASSTTWSLTPQEAWAAVRGATPDYLPLVGPLVQVDDFQRRYQKFSANANLWIPDLAVHHPGLYVCAGFGSRGLTTAPLLAEFLASQIDQDIGILPRSLIQAVSPSRFLRKKLMRGMV